MSVASSVEKQRKRALEDLRRGLGRRDAELASTGLLALDRTAREPHLHAAAALVSAEIADARAHGAWSRLVPWAKRVELEPRLATALGEAAANELRWALVWGCAFSGEWVRAERLWREIGAGSASLAFAMESWIAAKGQPSPPPPLAARFAAPAPDARLGVESIAPRSRVAELPRPSNPQDAEAAAIGARGALGPEGFEAWAIRTMSEADVPTACAVGEVASALALRDTLVRLETGARDPLAPLTLVARSAEGRFVEGARSLVALRLALRGIRDAAAPRASPGVLVSLVRGCMRDASLAPVVCDALATLAADPNLRADASEPVIAALGAAVECLPDAVLGAAGDASERGPGSASRAGAEGAPVLTEAARAQRTAGAALWAAGAVLASRRRERGHRRSAVLPSWLDAKAESMIGDGQDVAAWLSRADVRSRRALLDFVSWSAPAQAAARVIVAAANLQDERVRADVGKCAEALVGRLTSRYCASCGFAHEAENPTYDELSDAGKGVWLRIEDAVVGLSPWGLRLALQRAPSPAARKSALDGFAAHAKSGSDWIDAIAAAREHRLRKAPRLLLEQFVARFHSDAQELSSAFTAACRDIPRVDILVPLARALVTAADAASGSMPPHAAEATELARRLLVRLERAGARTESGPPRRRRKTSSPAQSAAPPESTGESRRPRAGARDARGAGTQLELKGVARGDD